jgi:hypothetical protein
MGAGLSEATKIRQQVRKTMKQPKYNTQYFQPQSNISKLLCDLPRSSKMRPLCARELNTLNKKAGHYNSNQL